jgi:hypothetical protein
VELVQRSKELLLAVGVGPSPDPSGGNGAADPDGGGVPAGGADAIAPGTDMWEALLRERVRHELTQARELQAAQARYGPMRLPPPSSHLPAWVFPSVHLMLRRGWHSAATVAQVEEERDAWRASTRQLETALLAMSRRCADLEYILDRIPTTARPPPLPTPSSSSSSSSPMAGPRFSAQPPPDLSIHGCPHCHMHPTVQL